MIGGDSATTLDVGAELVERWGLDIELAIRQAAEARVTDLAEVADFLPDRAPEMVRDHTVEAFTRQVWERWSA